MSDEDEAVDTGLVAAAVTMAAPELPPPEPEIGSPITIRAPENFPVTAVPKTQMPDGWTLHTTAAFVSDMAQNMYDLPYILNKHKITEAQYAILTENEFYKRALEAEIITWNSANSIQKRLALESAIAMETAMPTIAARLVKNTEDLGNVTALFKVLSEIAGTSGAKAQGGQQSSGEKFKIVINLGGDVSEREATRMVEVKPIDEGNEHANKIASDGLTQR